ncbi:dienelactone hydrolase-like enzyme [Halogeometricum borinquense DSM 11551]|uniref:Dienelactone hydrolase-like enzyme n=1 Tax=Halogeometricum borinquense (strain ATCC 700274 / DSM 11551 / JCM 10706 / KCTC 4070 / PR3) TaxID=469382 RepID=E4NUB0_HALBP|nr:alpha/beta family hydrolase [Halogeometricum borinquense]ADQ68630.1 dienelactone hydrolase-like enzyme [Halogeometricum borinquense DSM 11551]ELY25497.1 dienelactone hydrolase-like enzyme [Halogeometricum borinquense DSM 11551]
MDRTTDAVLSIPLDDVTLEGELIVPRDASGIVVFAHGSGSSRHSPRNNFVAGRLHEAGLATLLFDLLTEDEDRSRENRFDIPLLTDRLVAVTEWLRQRDDTAELTIGYFGSSTGAAAALRATASDDTSVDAVVSRGGRVDMADAVLDTITAPTLLIVGGNDESVRRLNQEAHAKLSCSKSLHVVPGAGHLFEGEGELEEVADVAADWFAEHLGNPN